MIDFLEDYFVLKGFEILVFSEGVFDLWYTLLAVNNFVIYLILDAGDFVGILLKKCLTNVCDELDGITDLIFVVVFVFG